MFVLRKVVSVLQIVPSEIGDLLRAEQVPEASNANPSPETGAPPHGEKGFTLPEMMIVLVIIGILTLIALPKFMGVVSKAKMTEAKTQLNHLHTLQKSHYYERDRYAKKLSRIGFEQQKLVTNGGDARYKIKIKEANTTGYTAIARAVVDFDNDGTHNVWTVDETGNVQQKVAD